MTVPGRPLAIISSVRRAVSPLSRAASSVRPASNASSGARTRRGATFATVLTYPAPPTAYSGRFSSSHPE